jgi:hypothetical protein
MRQNLSVLEIGCRLPNSPGISLSHLRWTVRGLGDAERLGLDVALARTALPNLELSEPVSSYAIFDNPTRSRTSSLRDGAVMSDFRHFKSTLERRLNL